MVSGKYSALSGAIAREMSMANVSANLANVTTVGYKKNRMSFEAMLRGEKQIQDTGGINYNRVAKSFADFSQGPLKETENPFHFAVVGDGFFRIRGNDGNLLTRNGNFVLNENGSLLTDNGQPVLDAGGNDITIPEALSSFVVGDEEGRIYTVDAQGNRTEVAQLAVTDVEDKNMLERQSDTSFRIPDGLAEIAPVNSKVVQGSLEMSNVNITDEMARMIRENRLFASYHNVLKSYSTIGDQLTDLGTLA